MTDAIVSPTSFLTTTSAAGSPAIGDVTSFYTSVSGAFATSTPTPAVSASSAGSAFLDDGSLAALVAQAADLVDRLGFALGALEIGLVLVGM